MTYQRTASIPLPDHPEYGIDLSDARTTDSQREERYLQLIYLPDERDRTDDRTGTTLGRREVYELAVREPRDVVTHHGTPHLLSAVIERHGSYSRESVLAKAAEFAQARNLPIYHEVIHLRPDEWTCSSDWAACPTCGSEAITLVTNLDESDLTLLCRDCDATADETERRELFDNWLHCPSCESGDVNIELSAPEGGVRWSCDDCLYDTTPDPIDEGYSDTQDPT
jgi:Zn finger protein HypA/HybF involved in hydrogenase expression